MLHDGGHVFMARYSQSHADATTDAIFSATTAGVESSLTPVVN